jgi:ankyrin repeat protein
MVSCKYSLKKIVRILLKQDANPLLENKEEKTALDFANEAKNKGIYSLIEQYTKNYTITTTD